MRGRAAGAVVRYAPTPHPDPLPQGERGEGPPPACNPNPKIDVDLAHLDPMFARVAHELRGRVKAQRLRIEHRGEKHVGVAAFHPARGVDQQREARRMALGKAVFAKALDLPEAALGEFAVIALGDHALDHLL